MCEDDCGFWVKGWILIDVEKGCEVILLLVVGVFDGLLIGYWIVKVVKNVKG